MLWGSLTAQRTGSLPILDSKNMILKYQSNISRLQHGHKWTVATSMLPRILSELFTDNRSKVLDRPSQSSDLSPIEVCGGS